jgi:hypothetical protein
MGYFDRIIARGRPVATPAAVPNHALASPLAEHDQRLHDVLTDVPLPDAAAGPEVIDNPPSADDGPTPRRRAAQIPQPAQAAASPVEAPTAEPLATGSAPEPPTTPPARPKVIVHPPNDSGPAARARAQTPPERATVLDARAESARLSKTTAPPPVAARATPAVPAAEPRAHRDPMQALLSALQSAEQWVRSEPQSAAQSELPSPEPRPPAAAAISASFEAGPSTSPLRVSREPETHPIPPAPKASIRIGTVRVEVVPPAPKRQSPGPPPRREPVPPLPPPPPFGWRQR